jgi:hypothetical protein
MVLGFKATPSEAAQVGCFGDCCACGILGCGGPWCWAFNNHALRGSAGMLRPREAIHLGGRVPSRQSHFKIPAARRGGQCPAPSASASL